MKNDQVIWSKMDHGPGIHEDRKVGPRGPRRTTDQETGGPWIPAPNHGQT